MRTWKTGKTDEFWRHAYNDAICEFELRLRLKKAEAARAALIDEIEDALRAGYSYPKSSEIRTALNVINNLLTPQPRPPHRQKRSTSPKKVSNLKYRAKSAGNPVHSGLPLL